MNLSAYDAITDQLAEYDTVQDKTLTFSLRNGVELVGTVVEVTKRGILEANSAEEAILWVVTSDSTCWYVPISEVVAIAYTDQ